MVQLLSLMESQCGQRMFFEISRQGNSAITSSELCALLFSLFYQCSIVSSFETLAEDLVEQNENFTNITLQGTNLIFQGTRVSTLFLPPHSHALHI